MEENNGNNNSSDRKPRHFYGRVYAGIWLIVIGLFFLLGNLGYFKGDVWGKLWPIFIILPGIFMLIRPRK